MIRTIPILLLAFALCASTASAVGGALLDSGKLYQVLPAQEGFPEVLTPRADLLDAIVAAKAAAKLRGWDVQSYDRISVTRFKDDIGVELSRSGSPTVLGGGVMLVLSRDTLALKDVFDTF